MDQKLVLQAVEAIQNPAKWERVLQHIMSATGAKAAMITLRDGKTCQIVNDDALERDFHSPLIQGFPIEAVVYYLQELRTIDPWAEAQISHYPQRPLLMSQICNPDEVPDQRFFSWLRDFGINDTVAFELNRMPGYWTACNLFIESGDSATGLKALEYAKEHQSFLAKAWESSQQVVRSKQSGRAALDHMSKLEIPACITGPNGEVETTNSAFDKMIEIKQIVTHGTTRRLSVPRSARVIGDATWLERGSRDLDQSSEVLTVSVSTFDPDPLYNGKREGCWLVSFRMDNGFNASVDELNLLTEQERHLLESVQAGDNVAAAGEKIGVKRSRAFDIWGSVKAKLDIKNAHQVR